MLDRGAVVLPATTFVLVQVLAQTQTSAPSAGGLFAGVTIAQASIIGAIGALLGVVIGVVGKFVFEGIADEEKRRRDLRDAREATRRSIGAELEAIARDVEALRSTILRLCRLSRAARVPTYDRYGAFVGIAYGLHVAIARYRLLAARYTLDVIEDHVRGDARAYNAFVALASFDAVFLADAELAEAAPPLAYDPRENRKKHERLANPAEYLEQRLNPDVLLPLMLVNGALISEGRLSGAPSRERTAAFAEVRRLIEPFDPRRTPVFWRMLIAQLLLCELFSRVRRGISPNVDGLALDVAAINPLAFPLTPPERVSLVDEPLAAARAFLRSHVVLRLRR